MPQHEQDDHGEDMGEPCWREVGRVRAKRVRAGRIGPVPIFIGGVGFGRSGERAGHRLDYYAGTEGVSSIFSLLED